jgi:integrase
MKIRAGSVSKYFTKSGERLWRYRFDGDRVNGKRIVISKQGFETRAAAMAAMQGAILASRDGEIAPSPPPLPKETLGEWLNTWLHDYAPQRCTPKTIEGYLWNAGYILNAKEGAPAKLALKALTDVDHIAIEAALYELLRAPAKRRDHLSPKTVRGIAGVLSVALNKAFRLGKILVNPLLRVELPKVERAEARALTADEVQHLRDVCRGDWTFAFVEVALATGARRGELLALDRDDVDWLNSLLLVSKSLEETEKNGLRIKRPKGGKVRKFRIGPTALAALRFHLEQQEEHRRLCGADYRDQRLVFCQPDGSYLMPHLVSQTIVRRLRKAGIKNASLHTLRHTHASFLLSNGVPLPAVSARLGHADVNITARVYSHMLPDDDTRAADAWETVVKTPIQ